MDWKLFKAAVCAVPTAALLAVAASLSGWSQAAFALGWVACLSLCTVLCLGIWVGMDKH